MICLSRKLPDRTPDECSKWTSKKLHKSNFKKYIFRALKKNIESNDGHKRHVTEFGRR